MVSKNCFSLQVGKQRPLLKTGLSAGQDWHWLKPLPEQVAQSGWQDTHALLLLENVPEGQEFVQVPSEVTASWPLEQVKQKSAEPAQVPHEELHLVQVLLSLGSTNVPDGQESTHLPSERNDPGIHAVHCSWSTVEATLNPEILQDVHLAPQATK